MIRSFEVLINAAHPELPLFEASTIVGSASTAIIKRVPPRIGNWTITRVYVECQYPDNTAIVADARVGSPGVWIANLPATEYSGRVKSGFVVRADAMTEPGETMSGYILGIADFAVYTRDLVIVPGTTGYTLRYFNTAPNPPKAGDVATVDGRLRFFDGIEWILFADTTLTVTENGLVLAGQSDKPIQPAGDYPTRTEVEQEIDRLAAYYITYNAAGAAFPTRADLINAQTYYSGGVARVPTRNDYAVVLADEQHGGAEYRYIYAVADGQTTGQWEAQYPIETNDYTALSNKPQIGGVELAGNKTPAQLGLATRGDITLTARGEGGSGYSYWTFDPDEFLVPAIYYDRLEWNNGIWEMHGHPDGIASDLILTQVAGPEYAVRLDFPRGEYTSTAVTATRTAYGYIVGDPNDSANPNRNKPVARQEDLDAANEVIAQNQTTVKAAIAAVEAALPYALATPVTIDTAQTDTSGGTTVNYGAVTCANRTDHPVAITAALDELRITFPAAVANHVRDFYLRVDVGTGSAALTAPAIVPVAPTGETITVEAPGGTMPTLTDGTASSVGTTMLYFTEASTAGKFMVKAEIIEEVA